MFRSELHSLHHCLQGELSLAVFRRSRRRASSRLLWLPWACPGDSPSPGTIGRIGRFCPPFWPRHRLLRFSFSVSIGLLQSVRWKRIAQNAAEGLQVEATENGFRFPIGVGLVSRELAPESGGMWRPVSVGRCGYPRSSPVPMDRPGAQRGVRSCTHEWQDSTC
jgi:hypothetical protein